jgi:hypothetical protein
MNWEVKFWIKAIIIITVAIAIIISISAVLTKAILS